MGAFACKACCLVPCSESYKGEWKGKMKHGEGVYRYSNNHIYSGQWHCNKRHGQGTMTYTLSEQMKHHLLEQHKQHKRAAQHNKRKSSSQHPQPPHHSHPHADHQTHHALDPSQPTALTNIAVESSLHRADTDIEDEEDEREADETLLLTTSSQQHVTTTTYSTYTTNYQPTAVDMITSPSYVGEWKNDMREGKGTYTDEYGGTYQGDWINDKKEGFGIYVHADGTIYQGEWKNDKCQGNGTITFKDGRSYTGEWLNGQYHGQGSYTNRAGDVLQCTYVTGQTHGDGTLVKFNGDIIHCPFHHDQMEGIGEYIRHTSSNNTERDGIKYVGYIKRGKMHGQGTLYWPSGQSLSGPFSNHQPKDGLSFIFITAQLDRYEGTMIFPTKGQHFKHGKGYYHSGQGEIYVGEYQMDKRHGQGVSLELDGTIYDGQWKDDEKDGHGSIRYPDGRRYIGPFKQNQPHGKGTIYYPPYEFSTVQVEQENQQEQEQLITHAKQTIKDEIVLGSVQSTDPEDVHDELHEINFSQPPPFIPSSHVHQNLPPQLDSKSKAESPLIANEHLNIEILSSIRYLEIQAEALVQSSSLNSSTQEVKSPLSTLNTSHLSLLPNLHHLTGPFTSKIEDIDDGHKVLAEILSHLKHLHTLSLFLPFDLYSGFSSKDIKFIPDAIVEQICALAPTLTSLSLPAIFKFTTDQALSILQTCTLLYDFQCSVVHPDSSSSSSSSSNLEEPIPSKKQEVDDILRLRNEIRNEQLPTDILLNHSITNLSSLQIINHKLIINSPEELSVFVKVIQQSTHAPDTTALNSLESSMEEKAEPSFHSSPSPSSSPSPQITSLSSSPMSSLVEAEAAIVSNTAHSSALSSIPEQPTLPILSEKPKVVSVRRVVKSIRQAPNAFAFLPFPLVQASSCRYGPLSALCSQHGIYGQHTQHIVNISSCSSTQPKPHHTLIHDGNIPLAMSSINHSIIQDQLTRTQSIHKSPLFQNTVTATGQETLPCSLTFQVERDLTSSTSSSLTADSLYTDVTKWDSFTGEFIRGQPVSSWKCGEKLQNNWRVIPLLLLQQEKQKKIQELHAIKKALKKEDPALLCRLCATHIMNTVFLECGHRYACQHCVTSRKLIGKPCPVNGCFKLVKSSIKTIET